MVGEGGGERDRQREKKFCLNFSDDPTTVDGLMTVASSTLAAFLQQTESDQQAYTLLYLHLLAVSSLLSRCDHFQTDQLSPFWGALKQHKKRNETPMKQKALDGLKTFYEYLKHQTKSTQPFPTPDWATIDWGRKDNHRSNEIFKFCSFCQHVVKVYTLFSEVCLFLFCGVMCVCVCVEGGGDQVVFQTNLF